MKRKHLGWAFNCVMGILISNAAVCQVDLEVLDADSNVITGSTYTIYGMPSANALGATVRSENIGPSDLSIGIKRYENGVQAGTQNFFGCMTFYNAGDYPLLYDGFAPHQILAEDMYSFGVYHRPNGLAGVSCYLFVWYDYNNPIDSVWANICFDTQSIGLEEIVPSVSCEVYPNPSQGPLNFSITLDGSVSDPRLSIYDQQGRLVWEKELQSRKGKVVINEGDLTSGIYLYRIAGDDRSYYTGQFVIADQ